MNVGEIKIEWVSKGSGQNLKEFFNPSPWVSVGFYKSFSIKGVPQFYRVIQGAEYLKSIAAT